jgi:ethanolamine ammonia-lyase small subunit
MVELKQSDIWMQLRRWTPARIGLGRVGGSLPTQALLDFELAHALARDAVHAAFDADALAHELRASGYGDPVIVGSQARDRREYLLRPDLGRVLAAPSRLRLAQISKNHCELAVVIADGLSALAPERHAIQLLTALRASLGLENVTVVIANQARVALGDAIGEILRAQAVLVLIGERPGLSSPDSLGAYLTWAPRVGRMDADRNCISNIRPEGLSYAEAAHRLRYLLQEARRLHLSGIALKDDSDASPQLPQPPGHSTSRKKRPGL